MSHLFFRCLRLKAFTCFTVISMCLGIDQTGLAADQPPNIVLILADDLGWSDLGCYGADLHQTPRLDEFALDSCRFTHAYAMSVCSPTRGMMLTGKHAARLGITIWSEGSLKGPTNRPLVEGKSKHDLPHSERTIASHLQQAGYVTGLVGKWHLGDANHYPETHGFDVNIGGTHWGAPQSFWWPYRGTGRFGNEFRYVPDLAFGQPEEYLTDRLTDEAIRFIDQAGKGPFLLYLAHHAPHTPIEAKPADVAYFQSKIQPGMHHQNPVYAAMVKNLDHNVGRVLDHLKAKHLSEKTVVIIASDNGGYVGIDQRAGQTVPVTSNSPLRSGKGSLYEGGVRVPLLIHWPNVTSKQSECHEPVLLADLFPTLAGAANVELDKNEACDGLDLKPLLANTTSKLDRDTLYFHYPHYYATTTPVSAVRHRDWKLLHYFENDRYELYNLESDPYEQTNLAGVEIDRVDQLKQKLEHWRIEVNAQLPSPNPKR